MRKRGYQRVCTNHQKEQVREQREPRREEWLRVGRRGGRVIPGHQPQEGGGQMPQKRARREWEEEGEEGGQGVEGQEGEEQEEEEEGQAREVQR